jgi:hypothetical protein
MSDEKLNQMYRDEGWGVLAEAAGFDPVNTESSARMAFMFSYGVIEDKDMTIARLHDVLRLVRDEWPEDNRKTSRVYGAVSSALPGTI